MGGGGGQLSHVLQQVNFEGWTASMAVKRHLASTHPCTKYEVKYMIRCILSEGTGTEFCWLPSHCALRRNAIIIRYLNLAK